MPANVVQDSNGVHLSDMIHNPTLSGLCRIRHKLESLPLSITTQMRQCPWLIRWVVVSLAAATLSLTTIGILTPFTARSNII